jgi:hypothetical protein
MSRLARGANHDIGELVDATDRSQNPHSSEEVRQHKLMERRGGGR